jgi:LmbE family N-acetylglucosaminyl deacetylase
MAHPDDETWVSGTLAKLADRGLVIIPVYITSGDKGSDRSGSGLTGMALAKVREAEAISASKALGLFSPIFMGFADGKVNLQVQQVSEELELLKVHYDPIMIFTFEAMGITGNKDHQAISKITSQVFKQNLIYFSISQTRATRFTDFAKSHDLAFKIKKPVKDDEVTHIVNVTDYSEQRIKAMRQHKTQFPAQLLAVFSQFSKQKSIEELIIKDIETKNLFEHYIED